MKKSIVLCACVFLLAGCQQDTDVADSTSQSSGSTLFTDAAAADKSVIAVVNGNEILAARIQVYAQGTGVTDENREVIIENMITSELIAQQAKKNGISDNPLIQEEITIAEQTVLGRAYVNQFFIDNPIDESVVQGVYEEMKEHAEGVEEYNASHILVQDKEQADELLAQIKDDPQAFAALAQEHSQDPGSGQNGGQLGWVTAQTLVPEFSAVMVELADGEISEPVQSTFGWHIIRVDERRAASLPALSEELSQRIIQGKRAELFSQHLEQLRQDAAVELF